VNNATYLIYVEDCGMQVAGAFGWPLERMLDQGFAIIARQHQIEYLRPAVLDDVLEVATWFSDNRRATAIRHTTVRHVNDGTLLARARTRWAWVDIKTGRPIHIPEGFMDDFAPNRSEGSP
jgi:acyl-CoA thioester hydrolase